MMMENQAVLLIRRPVALDVYFWGMARYLSFSHDNAGENDVHFNGELRQSIAEQ